MLFIGNRPLTLRDLASAYRRVVSASSAHIITITTSKGRQHPRRFKGICKAASDLGVTRQHLYLVLNGERESPRIRRNVRLVEDVHAAV